MSWGERSCMYIYKKASERPCTPSFQGCNVSCEFYTYDGKTSPDSVPNHVIENMLDLLAKTTERPSKRKVNRMLKKINKFKGM